jgi:PAS domain-containing protein
MRRILFSSARRQKRSLAKRDSATSLPAKKWELESFVRKLMSAITVDNADEGVLFVENGVIVGFNPQASAILGTPVPQTLWSRFRPWIAPESVFRLALCLDRDCRHPVFVQAVRPDGNIFDLRLQRLASFSWKGREVGVISLIKPDKTKPVQSRVKLPAQLRFSF